MSETDVEPSDEGTAAGWGAVDQACTRLYGERAPSHVGYLPGHHFGSVLQGCSAYRVTDHWHYVTYGLSNIFDTDESDGDGFSGWGYELTWRVRDVTAGDGPPQWPFTVLQRTAKWASDAAVLLDEHLRLGLGAPVTGFPHSGGPDTTLHALLLTEDAELGTITTPNGSVRFLQLVAVDDDDHGRAQRDGAPSTVERLRRSDPLLRTIV